MFDAEADLALLRFVDFTISNQLIPSIKMPADEANERVDYVNTELESTLNRTGAFNDETIDERLSAIDSVQDEIDPMAPPSDVIQLYLESLLRETNQVTPNKFLQKISPNLFGSYDPIHFNSPLLQPEQSQATKWVSIYDINRFTVDQLIGRLAESDIDLLSSLPWEAIQACPNCFSRSLAERKTETEEGKHYCSTCRKRVKPAYVPYYKENYTADPHIAVTKHRNYITKGLSDKLSKLRYLESLKVSSWKRRCYFLSIDQIDEEAYDKLALLYESFYADYTADAPDAKLQIQLCSNGGNVFQSKRIIALINANQHITHVQGNILYSAAFEIFFSVQCSRDLAPYAQGMYHLSRSAHYVLENGLVPGHKPTFNGEQSLALCKQIGMSDREIEQIKFGEDVYFPFERLAHFMLYSSAQLSTIVSPPSPLKPFFTTDEEKSFADDIAAIGKRFGIDTTGE